MLLKLLKMNPLAAAIFAFSFAIGSARSTAATVAKTIWEVDLDFDEFTGQVGGWEARNTNFNYVEYANINDAPGTNHTRQYNIVEQIGTDANTGKAISRIGQNASQAPISITTKIFASANNPWSRIRGGISNQGISSQMETISRQSRPGDWAVVAYQIDIPASYNVDARNFSVRLDNVNGSGELYEWAFVTVNERNLENPGFSLGAFDTYEPTTYSNLTNSGYYNADGTVKAGGVESPSTALAHGKTISQHLAGSAAGPAAFQVQPGWYAADKHNVVINDARESFDNPSGGTGWTENVFDVNAELLGIDEQTQITSFTVWMGWHDVAFDTDGDGRTRTGTNSQLGQISGFKIGSSDFSPVPEPSSSSMALLALLGVCGRRRRNASR
jgi:hypothetical protein